MAKQNTELGYARTMTRFAAAGIRSILREEGSCRLPLNDNVRARAEELNNALHNFVPSGNDTTPPDSAIEALQQYFFLAVTDMVKDARDRKFQCPVQVYIACFAYNEDDTFKAPSQTTSLLACLQFLLRSTALYHAFAENKANESVSALE